MFPKLLGAIDGIFLIEASGPLRETQARLLCGPDVVLNQLPDGSHTATSPKYGNKPVVWYDTLASVPKAESPFILAHEFFDALPIHAFEATSQGWRELLVSPAPANTEPTMPGGAMPEFALTRSEAATPYAILLPEMSVRYKALKKREGTVVEISPESLKVAEEISKRIGRTRSGAALIMDYGPLVDVPAHSLRGIRSHEMVSPFSHPGEVDLSADVDFHALAERALMVSDGVEVHGPVEQGAFLLNMGIGERFDRLVKGKEEEAIKNLKTGFERLVERDGGAMGKVYKAMAIVPERAGVKPVGFGGDV